jgi:hypothetical protein
LRTSATFDGRDITCAWQDNDKGTRQTRDIVLGKFAHHDEPLALVARDSRYAYVYDPVLDRGSLYETPFSIGNLMDVGSVHPDVAAGMKRRVVEQLVPRLKEYMNRPDVPPEKPFFSKVRFNNIQPQEAVLPMPADSFKHHAALPQDKWLSIAGFNELLGQSGADLPPVTIRYEIPNATYEVEAPVKTDAESTDSPFRFEVRIQEETDFKDITLRGTEGIVDLGKHEVKDGRLELTLRATSAKGARLLLIPETKAAAEAASELLRRQKELAALGYF